MCKSFRFLELGWAAGFSIQTPSSPNTTARGAAPACGTAGPCVTAAPLQPLRGHTTDIRHSPLPGWRGPAFGIPGLRAGRHSALSARPSPEKKRKNDDSALSSKRSPAWAAAAAAAAVGLIRIVHIRYPYLPGRPLQQLSRPSHAVRWFRLICIRRGASLSAGIRHCPGGARRAFGIRRGKARAFGIAQSLEIESP